MRIRKRLEACIKYTDGFHNLADIGTDHANVPILAVKRGYVMKAQAIDNKHGPYVIAYSNVKKSGLTDKIEVKLSDGFSNIDNDTDVAVVSGMGGETIQQMLLESDLKNIKRLILQPNTKSDMVRSILPDIGFKIHDELVVKDGKRLYDIIVLEKGKSTLTDIEILYGPINLQLKPHYFIEKLKKELEYLEIVIKNTSDLNKQNEINRKIDFIKEALK
jgi:tRNA (adenine22-N1)-methyltransferase